MTLSINKRSTFVPGFFALILVLISACTEKKTEENQSSFTDKQLGQMLVIGFKGTSVHAKSPVVQDIKQRNIGGMILYDYDHLADSSGRNIKSPDQLLKLNSALVGYSLNPPIIAIEQDGSDVSPLYSLYPEWEKIFGTSKLPDSSEIVEISRKFAQEFMVVGLNTNLHPRLDLKNPNRNTLNPGLISSDPERVVKVSNIVLDEYDTEKLLSVPKYFPGYSPEYLPSDSANDVSDIWTNDFLIPYKRLFSSRTIRAIQTSHSMNTNLDPSWPGTFSSKTINDLLRDSLGFSGVVFSDDLQKPIITTQYDLETSIEKSINAGVDILVFGNNFEYDVDIASKAIAVIQKLLREGNIKPGTIEASLARIDQLKQDVIAELLHMPELTNAEIIVKTAAFVRDKLEGEGSGHDWWHIQRVWNTAKELAQQIDESIQLFVVELAALLHDIADHKFHDGDITVGPRVAGEWLRTLDVDEDIISHVSDIIIDLSFKGADVKTPMRTIEGKVVQDADRLDAIGAIGIARAFAYGGHKSRELYNPEVQPTMHSNFEDYKKDTGHTINHFYEKLFLLKDRMNTGPAKKMAEERHKFMELYVARFLEEWDGKK